MSMPNRIELDDLLCGIQELLDAWEHVSSRDADEASYNAREGCREDLQELMNETWIKEWLG